MRHDLTLLGDDIDRSRPVTLICLKRVEVRGIRGRAVGAAGSWARAVDDPLD